MKKVKNSKNNNKIQKGGENVVSASVGLVNSMIGLGDSIFHTIKDVTHIGKDLKAGVDNSPDLPGTSTPDTTFNAPSL